MCMWLKSLWLYRPIISVVLGYADGYVDEEDGGIGCIWDVDLYDDGKDNLRRTWDKHWCVDKERCVETSRDKTHCWKQWKVTASVNWSHIRRRHGAYWEQYSVLGGQEARRKNRVVLHKCMLDSCSYEMLKERGQNRTVWACNLHRSWRWIIFLFVFCHYNHWPLALRPGIWSEICACSHIFLLLKIQCF